MTSFGIGVKSGNFTLKIKLQSSHYRNVSTDPLRSAEHTPGNDCFRLLNVYEGSEMSQKSLRANVGNIVKYIYVLKFGFESESETIHGQHNYECL